jgi:polyisoprenoid-binding protein YceI
MSTALIAEQRPLEHTTDEDAAVERWRVDPTRTIVEFEVAHLWRLHTVHGRFRTFDGSYVVGPGGSEIELTIDASSVDTGLARRDEHLRSPDFFYVALNPAVRFRSTSITGLGNGDVRVSGELEAAGATVPLSFEVAVRVVDGELELEGTTTVDHRSFGMSEGPLGNIRPPATLHVKTRLVSEARDVHAAAA